MPINAAPHACTASPAVSRPGTAARAQGSTCAKALADGLASAQGNSQLSCDQLVAAVAAAYQLATAANQARRAPSLLSSYGSARMDACLHPLRVRARGRLPATWP